MLRNRPTICYYCFTSINFFPIHSVECIHNWRNRKPNWLLNASKWENRTYILRCQSQINEVFFAVIFFYSATNGVLSTSYIKFVIRWYIYILIYLCTYILVYWSCSRIQCNVFLRFCTSFLFFPYLQHSNNHRNRDTFPSATVVNVVCVLCIAPSSEQIHMLYLQLNWSCFWFWCCCRCRCRCVCCRAGSVVPFQSIHIYCISGKAASKRATFTFALTWFHLFAKLWIQIIPIFQFSLLLKWGFCHHLMLVRYVHTSAACM